MSERFILYCDPSLLLSLRLPGDNLHTKAIAWQRGYQEHPAVWTPLHRVEALNKVRQLSQFGKITVGEARRVLHEWTYDLARYFDHRELDWRDLCSAAAEISAAHGWTVRARALDLLHVAFARELGCDLFATCDGDQFALATAAGLKAERVS